MACRFVFLILLIFSALSCSSEPSSQESSTESSGEDDILVEDGIKTIGEYGRWFLQGFVIDPIEETKMYLIATNSNRYYRALEMAVFCDGSVALGLVKDRERRGQLLLNYRSSSESHLAYALRAKWGSGTAKHIGKIWARCERNRDCQKVLGLFPYRESSLEERLTEFEKNKFAKVAPSLKEPMTTYDKLMLEVKVIEGSSGYLEHYIFDLDGFTEAYDALLAKGCEPIPPLTAVDDFALHTIGAVASKRDR